MIVGVTEKVLKLTLRGNNFPQKELLRVKFKSNFRGSKNLEEFLKANKMLTTKPEDLAHSIALEC